MKLFAAMLAAGSLFVACLEAGQFGTGFAVSPKGYLITCHHVIRGADRVIVHTPEGQVPAIIVALDPANDLAVLKIDGWNGRTLVSHPHPRRIMARPSPLPVFQTPRSWANFPKSLPVS